MADYLTGLYCCFSDFKKKLFEADLLEMCPLPGKVWQR